MENACTPKPFAGTSYYAEQVVFLADGAKWIKSLVDMHFPTAIMIIDLYYAREHLSDLCKLLFATDEKRLERYRKRWWRDLDAGKVEKIIRQAGSVSTDSAETKEQVRRDINYFDENKQGRWGILPHDALRTIPETRVLCRLRRD